MRISDWSSDVCSSDLVPQAQQAYAEARILFQSVGDRISEADAALLIGLLRSDEHTSELQSLMRISYAVFCLKKKKKRERMKRYVRITYSADNETQHEEHKVNQYYIKVINITVQ